MRSRKLKALPIVQSTLSKDQPEDCPTNWAETCHWNYNLIKYKVLPGCIIYILYYIFACRSQ
jgi:hypothetical protein